MKINNIKNVREFSLVQNNFYKIDKNNNFFINEDIELEGNFRISGCSSNYVFLFDQDNFETYIYKGKKQIIHKKEYAIIPRFEFSENRFFVGLNNGDKIWRGIYNVDKNELEDEYERNHFKGFKTFLSHNLYVTKLKEFIQINNFNKNEPIWQCTYASLTGVEENYVSSTIEENNGKLYVPISSNGRSGLFVLDVATGEEVAFYEDLVYTLAKDGDYIYTSVYEDNFCRINSKTDEKEFYQLYEVLAENGFTTIHDHRFTVKNNILYFTEYRGGVKLGVIDLTTKTLLYKYNFAEENGYIGSIQVSNGRIFVHTQDNTLHIFEEESFTMPTT